MSAVTAPSDSRTRPDRPARATRQERRDQRRRLKEQDRLSARLAELHAMSALLGRAAEVVGAGWVQGAWFTVATSKGERPVTAYDLPVLGYRPITGACLVGSVVEAAGGPATVRSQLVQRTLDLVWHTLREDPERPVRWCPGPRMRMLGLLELTSWNDAPGRTQSQVMELLRAGQRTADVQTGLCRAEQSALAGR